MHKKDAYNDIIYNYLHENDELRNKLTIPRKERIENYKAFKNG